MKKQVRAPQFKAEASRARDGIAMIYDIAGFSAFFNQPDVHKYMPKYLNHVANCIDVCVFGGDAYWMLKPEAKKMEPLQLLPDHRKFLGDGALYIWAPPKSEQLTSAFIVYLANRLWNVQRSFKLINAACADEIPFFELPSGIRFGLARGTVFELSLTDSHEKEYIGICVNLASRLDKYCAGLNFIASARLDIPKTEIEKHGYCKTVATNIKGFPKEVVVVDKNEYKQLDESLKKQLFIPFTNT